MKGRLQIVEDRKEVFQHMSNRNFSEIKWN